MLSTRILCWVWQSYPIRRRSSWCAARAQGHAHAPRVLTRPTLTSRRAGYPRRALLRRRLDPSRFLTHHCEVGEVAGRPCAILSHARRRTPQSSPGASRAVVASRLLWVLSFCRSKGSELVFTRSLQQCVHLPPHSPYRARPPPPDVARGGARRCSHRLSGRPDTRKPAARSAWSRRAHGQDIKRQAKGEK
jgi:hypothetical protein